MKRMLCLLAALLLLVQLPVSAVAEDGRGLFEQITGASGPDEAGQSPAQFEPAAPVSGGTDTTIMIYMCGSNLESRYGSASADIREICASGADTGKVNLLVFTGGSARWRYSGIENGSGIYQLSADGALKLAAEKRPRNMGSSATLRDFLHFGYEHFPAEHYALILWDHGGGSLQGICFDENYGNDGLTMAELNRALEESPAAETPLDWIGFDACLMASVETAKVVMPYAGYMVASEEVEPGEGWDYRFLKGIEADSSPEETGQRIIRSYMESLAGKKALLTMSLINLDMIPELYRQIGQYFGGMSPVAELFTEISRARREMCSFGRDVSTPSRDYDLVDLGDMVRRLSGAGIGDAQQAGQLLDTLTLCANCSSSQQECTGLSAYFPFYNKSEYAARIRAYREMGYSEAYERFLSQFGDCLIGSGTGISDGFNAWKGASTMAGSHKDTQSLFFMPLSEEQLAEIGTAELVALQEIDGAWRLVATQDAAVSADGSLYGEYTHVNLFLTDTVGSPRCSVPLLYTQQDDGMYVLQVSLRDKEGKETDARLICSLDPAGSFLNVEDVYLYDESTGTYSMRLSASLEEFSEAVCRVEERLMPGAGEVLDAFEDWALRGVSSVSWKLDDSWRLAFRKDALDLNTLSIAFKITDIFNNTRLSSPIPLVQKPRGVMVLTYDNSLLLLKEKNARVIPLDANTAWFSVGIANRTEQELVLKAVNLTINGEAAASEAELYGSGENGGLLPREGESRVLLLRLPCKGGKASIAWFSFDLLALSPDGELVGTVKVQVRL